MTGRRTYGTGSIRQRPDGRFEATARLGRGPDGRYQRRSVYGRTRSEVQAKLRTVLRAYAQGDVPVIHRLTTRDYLEQWLTLTLPTLGNHTGDSYRTCIYGHAIPAIGYLKLAEVTPFHLHTLYARLLQRGPSGKPLTPLTVRRTHLVLHSAFAYAERTGLIARNPASLIKPPKAISRRRTTLTAEDAVRLLQCCHEHRLAPFVWIALSTGLRGGEIMRLRWSDVDLVHGTLSVTRSKSASGRRVTALAPETVGVLQRLIFVRERISEQHEEGEHIVLSERGKPYCQLGNIRAAWYRLLAAHGLPRVTLHGLRHTWASLHRQLGTDLQTVSEMAGHASVSITADIYQRGAPELQREAAERLGRLLSAERFEGGEADR
jgi:integrase